MPAAINIVATSSNEIVLSERQVTSEWRVRQITEDVKDRIVRVNVELGPFVLDQHDPSLSHGTGGSRNIIAWENEGYDAVRDTWTNADLLAVVSTKLA